METLGASFAQPLEHVVKARWAAAPAPPSARSESAAAAVALTWRSLTLHPLTGVWHRVWGWTTRSFWVLTTVQEERTFGADVERHLVAAITLREQLRPYIALLAANASKLGIPPMRPLFVDFPADRSLYTVDDQYMFGSQYMVAPILEYRARARQVLFPSGARWRHYFTGAVYEGGGPAITIAAPVNQVPLFIRQ